MGRLLDKFLLLMWKNYKLQIRHPVQTFFQIFIPVLFCSQLLLFRGLVDPLPYPNGKHFEPFEIKLNSSSTNSNLRVDKLIAWSPCNVHLSLIMEDVEKKLGIVSLCFKNSSKLVNEMVVGSNSFSCGIAFNDELQGDKPLGKRTNFSLRFPAELKAASEEPFFANWHTDRLFPVYSTAGPRSVEKNQGGSPEYNQEGFLPIQKEVSLAVIRHLKETEQLGKFTEPNITMQRFPYPPWIEDDLLFALNGVTGLMLICSFLLSASYTVKALTNEKETQIKEAMKIMGLPNWLHWTAWFIKTFILLAISATCIIVLFKIRMPNPQYSVLTLSNVGVLVLLMILYICATITLCFAISVFFTQSNTAAAVAALVWFLLYFPFQITNSKYPNLSHAEKIALCLGSNSALPLAFSIIFNFEGQGVGIQWNNIWRTTSPDDTLMLGHIMLMLVFDTFLYLMIALYVEAIYPGEYGIPKRWNFIFTRSFWCGTNENEAKVSDQFTDQNPNNFEAEPKGLKKGIQIKNLRKVYTKNKVAVRGFNLNMYEGQITVLLGHNGAGKTTTMSMLTGMLPPTSGTAVINGYDINKNVVGVRDSLGLCPQYNVIFNELTVEEHLYFFGKLKGLEKDVINGEVKRYIQLLELQPKTKVQAAKLSGGMKRKLCIGIALCGNSKIVLLDEPTAGVDPAARRTVWNILQSEKKNRTILLSTHFMDEADLLGDRIAIMAGGKLQCCGSSFFLKKKYGAGYHLVMEKSPDCRVNEVTKLLRQYIPNIKVDTNVGSELSYSLDKDQVPIFERMLSSLENESSKLGIVGYGISLTTMEEVFMKVGADLGQEEQNDKQEQLMRNQKQTTTYAESDTITPHSSDTALNIRDHYFVSGHKLWRNQVVAMFLKRILFSWRSWLLHLIQALIPIIFVVLTMLTSSSMKFGKDLPLLDITLTSYQGAITMTNGTSSNKYYDTYRKVVSLDSKLHDYKERDLSENVLIEGKQEISLFRRKNLIGATFLEDDNILVWFNNEPYHSPPAALEYVMKSIIKKELGDDYDIDVTNHPLPYSLRTKLELLNTGASIGLQLATNIGLSMAFASSFFILFYIKERVTGAKHLQYVSGARAYILWGTAILWDLCVFIVISILLVITIACYQEDGFQTFSELARLFFLLILFVFAALPLTYLASFLFSIPSSGYTYLSVFTVFTGILPFMIVTVLQAEQLNLKHVADTLHLIFLIFPHYTISSGVQNINLIRSTYKLCSSIIKLCTESTPLSPELCAKGLCMTIPKCCDVKENYFDWREPGIGKNIVYSLLVGIFLTGLLLCIEYGVFKSVFYVVSKGLLRMPAPTDDPSEDSDVVAEKRKIRNMDQKDLSKHSLVLKDVTKYYGKFLAVNQLCLGVKKYECFGLLGINGAGKTSTFKMMTGDERISRGDAWVNGLSLKSNMKDIYKSIGYCPQFDALLDNLTGRETLIIFALLRGVTYKESKDIAEEIAGRFDFLRHIDKKIKAYSGGNKRKLSTAISLVGSPEIIYLDEPTTGMDPATKRFIWNNINQLRDSGKCVILTSHSMEECEALCTRLAIMVNGTFKCLGSKQHLKHKFSQGYTLMVKVSKNSKNEVEPATLESVEKFIKTKFPSAELKENYLELLSLYIPDTSMPWSAMFGVMEEAKTSIPIEDYSLGQCTLEQVFLLFTKFQREEK